MTDVNWVKSSRSGKQGNCVMAARVGDEIWVGDSKRPGEVCAKYTLIEWAAFREGVALGEFDLDL